MEKEITIKINTEELDIAIKKASQLLEILKEIQKQNRFQQYTVLRGEENEKRSIDSTGK